MWCVVRRAAYIQKVHCAVVGTCYTPCRLCTEHVYVTKSAFFEGGESLLVSISVGRGRRPPTAVGVRELD